MKISGQARTILTGERTALNFLQRLSGIATLTSKYVETVHSPQSTVHGPKVYDTRKTTPGLRYLEKYAVRCGGGKNHRMGLWDLVLVKDNHLKIISKVQSPKSKVPAYAPACRTGRESSAGRQNQKLKIKKGMKVEMETQNLSEVKQALDAGVDIIMLDNMPRKTLKRAVRMIRSLAG